MMKKTFALIAAPLALIATPALAGPRCSADEADLQGSFLIITADGQFCEGTPADQSRFEASLEEDYQQAERRRAEEERQMQIALRTQYVLAMKQGGLSDRDARRAADAAGYRVEQAARDALLAAREAQVAAENAQKAAYVAADRARPSTAAPSSAKGMEMCLDKSKCTFKFGDASKAFNPGLIRF